MSDVRRNNEEVIERLKERLKGGESAAEKEKILASKRVSVIKNQRVLPTEVNVVLTPNEVSAIVQKLVEEKLVIPNVGGKGLPNSAGNVSLVSSCCVDFSVSVVSTVSTVGVNHPVQVADEVKKTLTKDTVKVNVSLPDNMKIK